MSVTVADTNASQHLSNSFGFAHKPDELLANVGSGKAIWRITITPHASSIIEYALAFGEDDSVVTKLASDEAENFASTFGKVKSEWQKRFAAMFTSRNSYFSGFCRY